MKTPTTYPSGYNTPIYMAATSKILDPTWRSRYEQSSGFRDLRRLSSYNWLLQLMIDHQSCVINAITDGESERKRAQRFIGNEAVQVSEVIERACLEPGADCLKGGIILNYLDQTTITFADAVGRINGKAESLGTVGNGFHYGQNCLAGLLVDKANFKPLGLSSLQFYSNDLCATKRVDLIGRDHRPLCYRNTHKWVAGALQANLRCESAERLIHVADRESDNFNFLCSIASMKTTPSDSLDIHCVIRAKENRRVLSSSAGQESQKIRTLLKAVNPLACYRTRIEADERMSFSATYGSSSKGRVIKKVVKRIGRNAKLEVRLMSCRLDPVPLRSSSGLTAKQIDHLLQSSKLQQQVFTYIHIQEVDQAGHPLRLVDDKGVNRAIDWLLLTTLPVTDAEQALDIINIYRHRFPMIEQLFRGLKTDGFNIELAQQQSVKALQIVSAMAMKGSALVMKMIAARDQEQLYPIEDDFSVGQIEVLEMCLKKYEGKTELQSNPHPGDQLSWATWIIARIGGWKPGNKKRPPGPKTLQRGLERFHLMCQGVALSKQDQEDVSQP